MKMHFVTRLKLAFTRNLQKCNSDFDVSATKNAAQQQMAAAKATPVPQNKVSSLKVSPEQIL